MEPKTFDDEVEIDIRELLYVFRRKALLVAAVGLLVGCLTCAFTKFFLKPVYTSTSSMLVLTKETTLASLADLQMGSQLTKDYRELIMSRPVLEEVIENLGLETDYDDFLETITIDNPTDTRILRISVENQDAQLAAEIVNELCSIASDFIGDKMEVAPPKIIEEGQIPTVKTRPSMIRNTLIGMLVGGGWRYAAFLCSTIESSMSFNENAGRGRLSQVAPRLRIRKASKAGPVNICRVLPLR